jgi:hypothetical protein
MLPDVSPRFRLFPRYRRPSLGEIFGTTQAKRRLSRRFGLATLRDPSTPLKNMQRRAKRRIGYYSEPAKLARHTGCLLPGLLLAFVWTVVARSASVHLRFRVRSWPAREQSTNRRSST